MACYYCGLEGHTNAPHTGVCKACGANACARPPWRKDGAVHGGVCECGCRWFVCIADLQLHAALAHPKSPGPCFPAVTAGLADRDLSAAAKMLFDSDAMRDEDQARAMGSMALFLNAVEPGAAALRDAFANAPESLWEAGMRWGPDHPFVELKRPFFTEQAVERVLVLGARHLGMCSLTATRSAFLYGPDPHVSAELLQHLDGWVGGGSPPAAGSLAGWLESISTSGMPERRLEVRAQHIWSLLAEHRAPLEVSDIASWMLDAHLAVKA